MILEEFLDYYLNHTTPDVADRMTALLPNNLEKSAQSLAAMFERSDTKAFEFQLAFYAAMAEIRRHDPAHCVMFDDSDNICYPFFIRYAWERLPLSAKVQAGDYFGTSELEEIIPLLVVQREARNWFRRNMAPGLTQEDLFAFNEVIALINFSSGGEYSFLDLVYPQIKNIGGKVLDAGCGAGFASLMMSQYLEVTGIDACRPRLNRAQGMANIIPAGQESFLPRVINLIETEMGEMFGENKVPLRQRILENRYKELSFINGSLDNLVLPSQEFDAIVCLDVLEHTYDPSAVLQQFARVAKPGAQVFVTVPNSNGELYQKLEEESRGATFPAMLHLHHWEPASLTNLFRRYGFELTQMDLFDYLPPDVAERWLTADKSRLMADESGFPLQIFAVFRA